MCWMWCFPNEHANYSLKKMNTNFGSSDCVQRSNNTTELFALEMEKLGYVFDQPSLKM